MYNSYFVLSLNNTQSHNTLSGVQGLFNIFKPIESQYYLIESLISAKINFRFLYLLINGHFYPIQKIKWEQLHNLQIHFPKCLSV